MSHVGGVGLGEGCVGGNKMATRYQVSMGCILSREYKFYEKFYSLGFQPLPKHNDFMRGE